MILAFILLLPLSQRPPAFPAAAQSPSTGPTEEVEAAAPEGWRDLDRVILIVNEEMLTYGDLARAMARENRLQAFADESEARAAARRFHLARVKDALRVQAGQDLGLDPAQIDRRARDYLERRQEELKGPAGMATYLAESDMTLFELRDRVRDQICAQFWDNYVTGDGSVGQARPSRDRYVRPGYLRFAYRQCLDHPELLPRIGGRAQTVVLQQLFVDPDAAGGAEAGRTLAGEIRRRIVAGEDMGDLVERYDASKHNRQKRGITESPESRLEQVDPAIGAFVAGAKPGDVSEVQDYRTKDGHEYLRIVRLVERTDAVVPDLASPGVQKTLGDRVQSELSDWRLEQAYELLYRQSYVWPPEFASR